MNKKQLDNLDRAANCLLITVILGIIVAVAIIQARGYIPSPPMARQWNNSEGAGHEE